jgi:hypothetical protein
VKFVSGSELKTLSDRAFYSCSELKVITLPEKLESIGEAVFSGNKKLAQANIPDSVLRVGEYAFHDTELYKTSLEQNAGFVYADKWLIGISEEVRANLKKIGLNSFKSGIIGIADEVFAYCPILTEAVIPQSVQSIGRPPMLRGPAAPSVDNPEDPLAWHDVARGMTPNAMRRIRRIDVVRGPNIGDPLTVDAMFRDTHMEEGGLITIVHEYHLAADVDPATLILLSIEATPRVLPYRECPQAAASARRVLGTTTAGLRARTRAEFVGASTCTHLNDVLRALDDVGPLAAVIEDAAER